MVGRFRERDYQLAAQKHNDAFIKRNYHQQIARYFERECTIAKHYDSWNTTDLKFKQHLEENRKRETLRARRNKLRDLLNTEEELYKKELEERKKTKKHEEQISLEVLRERLKEKQAEQDLYLPRTCRRYQSYFAPKNSFPIGCSSNIALQNSRVCKDSTNLLNGQASKSFKSEDGSKGNIENQGNKRYSSLEFQPRVQNGRYFARYSRRSLEDTNIRAEDSFESEYTPARLNNSVSSFNDRCISLIDGNRTNDNKENCGEDRRRENGAISPSSQQKSSNPEESIDAASLNKYQVNRSPRNDQERGNTHANIRKRWDSENNSPWTRMSTNGKTLSEQMFLYLSHKELKRKIEELARKELHACKAQRWDEALRLRDMRNRLELVREKRLYDLESNELSEDLRKPRLENIELRTKKLAERKDIYSDSTVYSDEARSLWKKWVHEDEEFMKKDARSLRETLMNKLEQEWQNLAIRDKEMITRYFQNRINGSLLQDEHRLAARMASKLKGISNSSQ